MTSTGGAPAGSSKRLKLLVPTDFSKKSDMALEFALMYSQNSNAEVFLFHVHDQKGRDFRKVDKANQEVTERMRQAVMLVVERLAAKGVQHQVDRVQRRLSQGKPWDEILKMAGGISADIIIMGKPSDQAYYKKLVAKAPCTVVLVQEKDVGFIVAER